MKGHGESLSMRVRFRYTALLCLFVAVIGCNTDVSRPHGDKAPPRQWQALGSDTNTVLWSISGSVNNSNPNAWVAVRNGNDVAYVYGTNIFTLPTDYVNNTAYNVTVAGTDPSLRCSISNNTGTISNAPVRNISITCAPVPTAQFTNSFESFEPAPDWTNTTDVSWGAGGSTNVTGYCCDMPGAQAMPTSGESVHSGSSSLVYSGFASSGNHWAYLKVFDLSNLDLVGGAYLSYWIFPQSSSSSFGNAVAERQSAYSAVDVTLSDGTALRFRPGIFDQFGASLAPAAQGNIVLDTWNFVLVDIASIAGAQLVNLSIGWQSPSGSGGYRGYLDDVIIDYQPPPTAKGLATSWEAFELGPSWTDTADAGIGGGNVLNVAGLCCGASGPQAYVTSELAHTGTHSLVYAGRAANAVPNYAYLQVIDLSHSDLVLDGLSTLSYWVYPQSSLSFQSVADGLSANVALDVIFSDGSSLRTSGLSDSRGFGVTPGSQSIGLLPDTWNHVSIPMGLLAGRVPLRIDVGWDNPAAQGGYRGFIDDITISDAGPPPAGKPPTLVQIALAAQSSFLMSAGLQLVATGIFSDGSTKTLYDGVTYASDNPAVAAVDANGYVTTGIYGIARIRTSSQGITSAPYIIVLSAPGYQLGGTVTGLLSATNVALAQGSDHIVVGNGSFMFPTAVAGNSNFSASLANPTGQTCIFAANSNTGVMPNANTFTMAVTCSTNLYSLGGLVAGLLTNTNVTLSDGYNTLVQQNGVYVFPTLHVYSQAYSIGLVSPAGQHCSFNPNSAGAGTMPAASVVNANVLCVTSTYPLGGNVSGVVGGNVTLTNLGNGDIIVVGNGNYIFDQNVAYGANYNVIATPPSGSSCSVTSNDGNMVLGGVFDVNVTCQVGAHVLGGAISGLISNTNVTLTDTNDTISAGNGNFAFPTKLSTNSNFVVQLTNPVGQSCLFSGNSNVGVMPAVDDYNVLVTCSTNSYSLGGNVTGLLVNTNVTLTNGNDTLSAANGNFTFPTGVAYDSNFSAGLSSPAGQHCVFVGNSNAGVMPAVSDFNVSVSCNTLTYSLGGSISGLLSNTNVTLADANDTIYVPNGSYTFPTQLPYDSNYVIVLTPPTGQSCVFSPAGAGNGTMPAANVTTANVLCVPNAYSLGGAVSGLSGGNVTLTNGSENLVVTASGSFTFATSVNYGSTYSITVTANPPGSTCQVTNDASGTMSNANITDVAVTCASAAYLIVQVSNIPAAPANSNVVLVNGSDTVTATYAAPTQTFATPISLGTNYNVIIQSQPGGATCTPANQSGTAGSGNVTVNFTCSPNLTFAANQNASAILGQTSPTGGGSGTSASIMYGPTGKFVLSPTGTLYVADYSNFRVLGFNPIPTTTGTAASYVLGQNVFTTRTTSADGNHFNNPQCLATDGNVLIVADESHNRIVIYNGFPTANPLGNVFLGQLTATATATACNANSFSTPYGVYSTGGKLLVGDSGHNRVLIFNSIPVANKTNADLVLGQTTFTACSSGSTATTMNLPKGLWSDGTRLLVADSFNQRILVWATFPTTSGQPADYVLGQATLTGSSSGSSNTGLYYPADVTSDGTKIYVADTTNNRVVIYDQFPTSVSLQTMGQVLGQASFATTSSGTSLATMKGPAGVTIIGSILFVADVSNNRFLMFNSQ